MLCKIYFPETVQYIIALTTIAVHCTCTKYPKVSTYSDILSPHCLRASGDDHASTMVPPQHDSTSPMG